MRKIVFFFISISLFSQNKKTPSYFATNNYGVSKNSDYFNSNIFLSETGQLQLCAFGGGIVWQNNVFEKVEQLDSIENKKWSKIYYETKTKRKWLISKDRVDIYANDKLLIT